MTGWAVRAMGRLLVLGVVVTGCSIDEQGTPVVVPDDDVPFGLLEPPESVPSTTTTIVGTNVTVYLVGDAGLAPVQRVVEQDAPADVVVQLGLEPTEAEAEQGLRSELAVGEDEALVGAVDVVRGVAQVDLTSEFAELGSDRQLLAIAQLVLTLTSRPGVGQVAFTLDTAPIDVPRADATITSDPVTRADYSSLLADP